ncbi:MAG TPA: hypothetical protein GYA10_17135 [Alphaproteobacteria bacterium]|nr:hypothetical protein [Alphaproteobacteria bacterium]
MRALIALAVLLAAGLVAAETAAQSLTPMERKGVTPSGVKAFKLLVGNPYPGRMTFLVVPMDAAFRAPAGDAVARPDRLVLAPGHARSVVLAFKLDPTLKERTIGLCIVPEAFDGPILPRVCGRYTGLMR